MDYYLLALRSLTYALRAQEALNANGVSTKLVRTPASVSPRGCSHSLKVPPKALNRALSTLREDGLKLEKLFATSDGASFIEVEA